MYWDSEKCNSLLTSYDKQHRGVFLEFRGQPIIFNIDNKFYVSEHPLSKSTVSIIQRRLLNFKLKIPHYCRIKQPNIYDVYFSIEQQRQRINRVIPAEIFEKRDIELMSLLLVECVPNVVDNNTYNIHIYRALKYQYTIKKTSGLSKTHHYSNHGIYFTRYNNGNNELWCYVDGIEKMIETNDSLKPDTIAENAKPQMKIRDAYLNVALEKLDADVSSLIETIQSNSPLFKRKTPAHFDISVKVRFDKNYFYVMYLLRNAILLERRVEKDGFIYYIFRTQEKDINKLAEMLYFSYSAYEHGKTYRTKEINDLEMFLDEFHPYYRLSNKLDAISRKFHNQIYYPPKNALFPAHEVIENKWRLLKEYRKKIAANKDNVMRQFGKKPIWKNEYLLYFYIKTFFEDAEYQKRFVWLEQQSLDIFIPSLKIGIEYQGQQHFLASDYFGGDEQFENRKTRDKNKQLLCEQYDVQLLQWDYKNQVTVNSVVSWLSKRTSLLLDQEEITNRIQNVDLEAEKEKISAFLTYGKNK
jgi:hypothetical protein